MRRVTGPALPAGRFRVFFWAQLVSLLGDGVAILAVPLLMLQLTGNALLVALSAAPRIVGYLLVGLPGGALADRLDPRKVMVCADTVRAASFLALAVLALTGHATVVLTLVLAFTSGAAGSIFESSLTVIIKDLVPGTELIRVNSYLQMASQASLVAGPALVGLLTALVGIDAALAFNALTFLCSVAGLLLLPRPADHAKPAKPSAGLLADLRQGIHYIRSTREVLVLTLLPAAVNFVLAAETLIVFYARTGFGASETALSVLVAVGGAGGVLGAFVAARVAAALGEQVPVVLAVCGLGVSLGLMGVVRSLPFLVALNVLLLGFSMMANVVIQGMRQRIVPRELLGRISSTSRVLMLSAYQVGVLLTGSLTQATGGDPRWIFVVAGVLSVVAGAAVWYGESRKARATTAIPQE
ncbi:MFS transporter [Amycolatopsis sp. cmx-4-68]|uniref:MFS transporter n=1 Tax=Amycolatopsis sp. cmx-4-68 TaxID=2790938 RepID=UPI00397CCAE3